MKFFAIVIAVLFVVSALTSCGNEPSANSVSAEPASATAPAKTIKVGATFQSLQTPYIVTLKEAIVAEADKLGIQLIATDGQGDPAKQVGQVENFIAQKVDVIILDPQDYNGCAPAVDDAVKAGIPIITLIQKVANQDKSAAYVGSEAKESGRIEAGEAAADLNGKGNIVVIEGPMGSDAQLGRLAGIKEVINQNPGMKIVRTQSANWDRATALKITEDWLQSGIQFDAVLAENDDMAMGALRAIQDKNLVGVIKVYGIDALPEALEAIQNGQMSGTVFQDAVAQGRTVMQVAKLLAQGQKVDSFYLIPYVEVRAKDVPKYLNIPSPSAN